MKKNIFLSVAWPYTKKQEVFMKRIKDFFEDRGYQLHTVDIKQYKQSSTIKEVLNLMEKCDGIIVLAFRRMEIKSAVIRPGTDLDKDSETYKATEYVQNQYKTSDWCNIEIGMAFGMKLPILLFLDDFLIDQSIYMDDDIQIIQFNLEEESHLKMKLQKEWLQIIDTWIENLKSRGGEAS